MSLQAYQSASRSAENPREAEYRLFGQVTRALMAAAELDPFDLRGRIDALDWNRRMWTALGSDCAASGNQLPDALRASIISLSIWVGKHTSLVIKRKEDFGPLIDVNRMIMQGLASNAQKAA